jgi:hypothetical protein
MGNCFYLSKELQYLVDKAIEIAGQNPDGEKMLDFMITLSQNGYRITIDDAKWLKSIFIMMRMVAENTAGPEEYFFINAYNRAAYEMDNLIKQNEY